MQRIAPRLWSKNEADNKPRVLITIPTWNEEIVIGKTLETLKVRIPILLPHLQVTIEVADNGSTDRTREIVGQFVESRYISVDAQNETYTQNIVGAQRAVPLRCGMSPRCILFELHEKGKGMAIRRSWEKHLADFDVLAFMDADLASDIQALPDLIDSIIKNQADLVCGSRFVQGSKVERKIIREAASHLFNFLQKLILHLPVKDAQCGFKAISIKAARELLPFCEEDTWLLDSELLALAVKRNFRIEEIPVTWVEFRDPHRKSAVRLWKNAFKFLLGLAKIRGRIK